jgi:hypothetical protein
VAEVRNRLLALLQRGQVRAVLTGHLHYPVTKRVGGTWFLSDRAVADGIPHGKQPAGWMLLTVPRGGEVRFEFQELR